MINGSNIVFEENVLFMSLIYNVRFIRVLEGEIFVFIICGEYFGFMFFGVKVYVVYGFSVILL